MATATDMQENIGPKSQNPPSDLRGDYVFDPLELSVKKKT